MQIISSVLYAYMFYIVSIYCDTSGSNGNLYKIYSRYQTAQYSHIQLSKLQQNLPQKRTIQQQMSKYYNLFQTNTIMQQIDTSGDPDLNTNFFLTNNNNTNKQVREKQTIFVMGKQMSKIFLQITLTNDHDDKTKINNNQQEGVYIFMYNTQDGQILAKQYILKNNALIIDINTQLYGIEIMLPSIFSQNKKQSQINVDLKISLWQPSQQNFIQYFQQYQSILKRMHNEASMIFLDSLEDWDIIDESEHIYYRNQKNQLIYVIIQEIIFLVIAAFELVYIRKLINDCNILI